MHFRAGQVTSGDLQLTSADARLTLRGGVRCCSFYHLLISHSCPGEERMSLTLTSGLPCFPYLGLWERVCVVSQLAFNLGVQQWTVKGYEFVFSQQHDVVINLKTGTVLCSMLNQNLDGKTTWNAGKVCCSRHPLGG